MRARTRKLLWWSPLLLLGVVLGVVLGALFLAHGALQTRAARTLVNDKLSAAASEALGAKLEIDALEELSIFYVRVRGVRVQDESGNTLASLQRLTLRLNPLALLSGVVAVTSARLEAPFVDLGAPLGEGGGLPGLFAGQPDEPVAPADEAKAITLRFSNVSIERGRVRAQLQDARWEVAQLAALLHVEVSEVLSLELARLRGEILREQRHAAQLQQVVASYGSLGQARLQLALGVAGTQLRARAQLGPQDAQGAQSLSAHARVAQLSSQTAAALGVQTDVLTAPIDVEVSVRGSTHDLRAQARVDTPGGVLKASGEVQPDRRAQLKLYTQRLHPARFTNLSLAPLALQLHASAETDDGFASSQLALELRDAHYDDHPLPTLRAEARWDAQQGLTVRELLAHYADAAELRARGRVSPAGAAELHAELTASELSKVPGVQALLPALTGNVALQVSGTRTAGGQLAGKVQLALRAAGIDPIHARTLALDAQLSGSGFDALTLSSTLRATQLQLAEVHLPELSLRIDGGPSRYQATASFGARGGLHAHAERQAEAWLAGGELVVALRDDDWLRAGVGALRYRPGRALQLRDVHASYRKASVRVQGTLDPAATSTRSRLSARIDVPELAHLTKPWLEQPIEGRLVGQARLEGRLQRPAVWLDARYRSPQMEGLRDLDVHVKAHADLPRRSIEVLADARARRAHVEAHARTTLRGRALSAAALTRGKHELDLKIVHLPLTELSAWPKETFAMAGGELSGALHARGTLQAPEIEGQLQTSLHFRDDPDPVTLSLQGEYGAQLLRVGLSAEDARGKLLRTQVRTELRRGRGGSPREGLMEALTERAWEVSAWLGARRIDELPAVRALGVDEALWPAQVGLEAKLAHTPGQEPVGELKASMVWPKAREHSPVARCGERTRPQLQVDARMADGQLHAHAQAALSEKPVLEVSASSHAPLGEWLKPEQARPVSLEARFSELQLADVPLVCEQASGSVSGTAALARALTQKVTANVDLRGSQLRFTESPAMDARLRANADDDALVAHASLTLASGSAELSGHVPIDVGGRAPTLRMDEPARAEAHLRNMEVSALLGPITAVRGRSGQLDGELHMTGSLEDPQLRGELQLRNVSIVLPELGQPLENVSGRLTLSNNVLRLGKTRVHDREGWAELSGELRLRSLQSMSAELQLKADDFPVRRSGVILARFDGEGRLRAELEPERTQIDITVRKARVELTGESLAGVQALGKNPDIVYLDAGETLSDAHAEPVVDDQDEGASALTVLRIDASQPFWMRRSDFSALLTAKLRVELGSGAPSVSGRVGIERGVIELLGQMFDIERGSIEFAGGSEVEPVLDLTATRRAPGGPLVSIRARGTLAAPELEFTVDDEPVTAGEALAAATGTRTSDDGGSSVQKQIGSVASGMAAGVLTLAARRELGEWVPVLALDTGDDETTLRAGVGAYRLVPGFMRSFVVDAYVEGIFSTADEAKPGRSDSSSYPAAAVLLELRHPYDLLTELQLGPGSRWSFDLSWEP